MENKHLEDYQLMEQMGFLHKKGTGRPSVGTDAVEIVHEASQYSSL